MVKVCLKDGGIFKYDNIKWESVWFNEEFGFLRINAPNETVLIPWGNIRFVQADVTANDEEGE